jgi:hypothetical protein
MNPKTKLYAIIYSVIALLLLQALGYVRQWSFSYHFSGATQFNLNCGLHDSGTLHIQGIQVDKTDNLQVPASSEGGGSRPPLYEHTLAPLPPRQKQQQQQLNAVAKCIIPLLGCMQTLVLPIRHYITPHEPGQACTTLGDMILEQERLYGMLLEHICRPLLIFSDHPRIIQRHLMRSSSSSGSSLAPPDRSSSAIPQDGDNDAARDDTTTMKPPARRLLARRPSELEGLLSRAPPNIMMAFIVGSTAAAATAVLWAWRK